MKAKVSGASGVMSRLTHAFSPYVVVLSAASPGRTSACTRRARARAHDARAVSQTVMRFRSIICAVALVAAVSSAAADGATRRIKFPGGETTVQGAGEEHVVVTTEDGALLSDSWCYPDDSGSYDQVVDLFVRFKSAVASNDRETVADLVMFPLRVNGTHAGTIRNHKTLLQRYDKVFTKSVIDRIRSAEPPAVFSRNGMAMLGNGVVWAGREDASATRRWPVAGRVLVEVINE